jgi:hypothetical protein
MSGKRCKVLRREFYAGRQCYVFFTKAERRKAKKAHMAKVAR